MLPAAKELYRDLEAELGTDVFFELPLVRSIANRGESNSWLARSGLPAYQGFMDDQPKLGHITTLTHPAFSYGGVLQAGRTDLHSLCKAYRQRVAEQGHLIDTHLDYQDLQIKSAGAVYRDRHYDRIIFCEGWRARYNPWFSYLPHRGAKGEVFLASVEGPSLKRLFKNRIFLVPRQSGNYWIGATTQNQFDHDHPTEAGRQWLQREVEAVVKVPVKVHAHQAAVRPTVKDRRPLLGRHPEYEQLIIFNGLGTKGASLAPLMSQWLFDHLDSHQPLPEEVDISRFYRSRHPMNFE